MATHSRTQEIEHEIGASGRLSLRVASPEVLITGIDGTVARVRVRFEIQAKSDADADETLSRAEFDVHRADGSLEVTQPRHSEVGLGTLVRLLGGDRIQVESVEVEVPRAATVEYGGVSGDVSVRGLTGPQAYKTVSGDVVIDGGGGDIRVQAVSADVSIRSEEPIGLEAKTVSGDLSAFTPWFQSLRAVTVSGDVELEGDLTKDGTHRVETVSGDLSLGAVGGLALEVRGLSTDVEINLPHRTEGSRERRRYVVGDGAARVSFSSMSGDVSVSAARRVRPGATPPSPPSPPTPPTPPAPPTSATPPIEAPDLAVLRALERGEIDVDEAARRLAGGGGG